jgi:hypothetical protein
MSKLSSSLCALALLAVASLAASPAAAQSRVIVRGAHPILPPAYSYSYGGAFADSPGYIWGSPQDRYYDPAGKFPDHRYYGPPAVDLVLARTLDRNRESMLGHMLACQRAFPSYNPATNFYRGRHGQPQVCYR